MKSSHSSYFFSLVLLLLVVILLLAGCAYPGATSGGATYYISVTNPNGVTIEAKADVVNESESVEAVFIKDDDGIRKIEFRKVGTMQAEKSLLDLMNKQTELLNSLVTRSP